MTRSFMLTIPLVSASVAIPVLLASCSPRSCEDAEAEFYSRLDECEVDYFFDSDAHVCDDVARQLAECRLSCAEAVSCEAVRGENKEEANKLFGCMNYCSAFILQAIPSEEVGQ